MLRKIAPVATIIALSSPFGLAQDSLFNGRQYLTGGFSPITAAFIDVNADGRLDGIVPNNGSKTLSILLANSSGFNNPIIVSGFSLSDNLSSVASGDFNSDGKVDLIIGTQNSSPYLLLGSGNGNFSAPNPTNGTFNGSPVAIVANDVNNNGTLDLVAHLNQKKISVMTGNGLGGFTTPIIQFNTVGTNPSALAVSDVNNDGRADVAAACSGTGAADGTVSMLMNLGGAAFGAATTFTVGANTNEVLITDLNGDGKRDVLVASFANLPLIGNISMLVGNGAGAFSGPVVLASGMHPDHVAAADVNNDTIIDIIGNDIISRRLFVMLGVGAGAFGPPINYVVGEDIRRISAFDWNNDGKVDIAAAGSFEGKVALFYGDGLGNFGRRITNEGVKSGNLQFADLNVDGNVDILCTHAVATDTLSVLTGDGAGHFGPLTSYPGGADAQYPNMIDINGDGVLDVAVVNSAALTITILHGDAGGGFVPGTTLTIAAQPTGLVCGDLNHDGGTDLVVATSGTNSIRVSLNSGNGVYNSFVEYPAGTSPASPALADINEDNHTDIIVSNFSSAAFSYFLGNGAGAFGSKVSITPWFGSGANVGDVNGDGHADVVQVDFAHDKIAVYAGNGNGTFAAAQKLTVGTSPARTFITDMNGDGITDILVTETESVTVMIGSVLGVFSRSNYANFLGGATVNDLNADGKTDVVVMSSAQAGGLSLLYNKGAHPSNIQLYGTGTAGCLGEHGMNLSKDPKVGTSNIKILCTNTPPNSLGAAAISDVMDARGSDIRNFGILFHIGFDCGYLQYFDLTGDGEGNASAATNIANNPSLAGLVVYVQSFWLWQGCDTTSPFQLSSSRGLSVTLSN